jgi:PAS domain S-box-containing protein
MEQPQPSEPPGLRRVIDALPRAVVVTDPVGTIALWSAAAQEVYGWTEAEVVGRSILEVLGPGPPGDGERLLEALARGETYQAERTIDRRDGTPVRVVAATRALLGPDGEIEWIVGASEDVTQLAELEEEARRLADHLTLALDAGGLGTWRWDRTNEIVIWDEQMERLFGLEPGTFDGSFETYTSMLHPDDRAAVLATVQDALDRKGAYRVEHRVVAPSGEVRWIEGAGRVTLDAHGEITGTIGCSHEVTDRVLIQHERERLILEARESVARERLQRERLELMAAVNAALEEADELPEVLRAVASVLVPRLGDWCSLHVLPDADAVVPVVETGHVDPAMVALAQELQERYPYDPDAATGVPRVIRSGEAEFYPEITDEMIDEADASDEQRDVVRHLRLRSAIVVPLRKRDQVLGAMQCIMTDDHRRYTEDDLALAEAVAGRVASSLDNRRLRDERDHIARIDARLAELGRRLVGLRALDAVLRMVADHAPAALDADAGHLGLLVDAEHVRLLHPAPAEGAEPEPDATVYVDPEGSTPMARALREARIVFADEGDDPDDPAEPGTASVVASPLFDDSGRPIGVLVFEWAQHRRFGDLDRDTVETVSRLCGQAISRAQLARQTEELAAIASSMAPVRTSRDVALLLRDHATRALGANVAVLRLADAESSVLRTVIDAALPAELGQRFERVRLEDRVPAADAAREDRAIWLPDAAAYRAQYPDSAEATAEAGLGAVAALPLHSSEGTVIGVVGLAWPAAMRFDAPFRTRLLTLCDLAAQTLERARLHESEHELVGSMQRQLLPPMPEVDGLELAAFYEPAAAAIGMGGDWYATVPLEDGSLVAILGDIVGHGVEAVADMARLQHLLTGLVRSGTPLGELLARANDMLLEPDPIWGTAVLLHVDHPRRRIGHFSAGHPFPLVRDPGGTVHQLQGCQQPMMGLPIEPAPLAYVDFPPGSMVLAYTDGLIERRNETITDGIDRLAACFGEARLDGRLDLALQELVATVHATDGESAATTDDIASLLIRSVPA